MSNPAARSAGIACGVARTHQTLPLPPRQGNRPRACAAQDAGRGTALQSEWTHGGLTMRFDFDPREFRQCLLAYMDEYDLKPPYFASTAGRHAGHFSRILKPEDGHPFAAMDPHALFQIAREIRYPLRPADRAARLLFPQYDERWKPVPTDGVEYQALTKEMAEATESYTCNHAVPSYLLPDEPMDWFDAWRLRSQGYDEGEIQSWQAQATERTEAEREEKGNKTFHEWVICREATFRVAARKDKSWIDRARDLIWDFREVSAVGIVEDHPWRKMRRALREYLQHKWHAFSVINGRMVVLEPTREFALISQDPDTVRLFRAAFVFAAGAVHQDYFAPRARATATRMRRSGQATRGRLGTLLKQTSARLQTAAEESTVLARYFHNSW